MDVCPDSLDYFFQLNSSKRIETKKHGVLKVRQKVGEKDLSRLCLRFAAEKQTKEGQDGV